jgi:hypothetical protein
VLDLASTLDIVTSGVTIPCVGREPNLASSDSLAVLCRSDRIAQWAAPWMLWSMKPGALREKLTRRIGQITEGI